MVYKTFLTSYLLTGIVAIVALGQAARTWAAWTSLCETFCQHDPRVLKKMSCDFKDALLSQFMNIERGGG